MIWIKNHGIRGESDNLRIPLAEEIPDVVSWKEDAQEAQAVVKVRAWTGIDLDVQLPDDAIENGFSDALGDQIRWAHNEDADHPDFDDKAEELDAFYDGTHPDLSDAS